MPATSTPRTPEGRLIRRARKQEGLSIPAAASRAKISAEHWGNIERGYRSLGTGEREDVTGTPDMIALMARTIGLTQEQVGGDGERPDAAEEMAGARILSVAAPAGKEDTEHREVIAAVRKLYPGDQVAESIMTQWDVPLDVRQAELDNWRATRRNTRAQQA